MAVVGAGLCGCLAALAFVRRGYRVVLLDRAPQILNRASRYNEGKIHLGFTYGLDASGLTAARMFEFGSRFQLDLKGLVGPSADDVFNHRRVTYAMPSESLLPVDGALRHIASIEAMHETHLARGLPTLSQNEPFARRLTEAELETRFSEAVIAAFEVAEPTVDCDRLCDLVEHAVRAEPKIEIITGFNVQTIERQRSRIFEKGGACLGPFDYTVNAAWDGMPAIEQRSGRDVTGFCLRGKTGFFTRAVSGVAEGPVTFTWGPFGDLVPQSGGRAYLSWYPSCRMGFTTEVSGGSQWFDDLTASFDFDRAYRESCEAFKLLIPSLEVASSPEMPRAGAILASARTDIDDPGSGLHRRTHFGIFSHGNILSVDTGKLTCAPGLALRLAAMI